MSSTPPPRSIAGRCLKALGAVNSSLRALLLNPFITGPLLYTLTLGSPNLRARLLSFFDRTVLATNREARLSKLVGALKILFTLGTVGTVSAALDKLALEYWHVRGKPSNGKWVWDGRQEVIILTGGCSGFGYEMTKLLAGKAQIVILDVAPLPKELEELSGVHYYKCDLTDTKAIVSVSEQIRRTHGTPSVLINNAGIGWGKTVLDTTNDEVEAIIKVNLMCHFVLIKEFVPGMLKAQKGHVVTLASMASFASVPGMVDYSVTKVGAMALHEGLRNELIAAYENGDCVNMTVVHPGWHDTGITKPFQDRLKTQKGVQFDPAINTAEAVVKQILAAKSGSLFVPKEMSKSSGSRRLPIWLQDLLVIRRGVLS